MSKVLQDSSGIYNLDNVASIHPMPIRGDARDQTKITETFTQVSTVGGQTHSTSIPWAEASKAALAHWGAGPAAADPPVT
jgi:hypothetical protein